ncbi:hypothetical protein AMJ49_01110 [Parcubacteria bacterium DG_74_2]|nr:MAG: hypothetical protein AMJ49_01110 [Parcubacteria bacterium DG_74_2]
MQKIGLVTEEGADLPKEIIEKYQIAVAPIKMDWPEIENLPGENTFQKMRELEKSGVKSFGKTSQPSPKDFLDAFKKQLERFDKILCITLTSKLSGTYNSAVQARNFLEPEDQKRIFIVDSLSVSAGESLLILRAVDLIKEGKEIEEIAKELEKFVPQIHTFAIIKNPKWAEASGRLSSFLANWLRRMAKIGVRPLIKIKKGVVVSGGIITGAKDIPTAIFRRFAAETKKLIKEGKEIRVVITHGDDLEGAQRLKEMIEKEFKNAEVAFLNLIDNVLGILTGPNAMLCAWCEK